MKTDWWRRNAGKGMKKDEITKKRLNEYDECGLLEKNRKMKKRSDREKIKIGSWRGDAGKGLE